MLRSSSEILCCSNGKTSATTGLPLSVVPAISSGVICAGNSVGSNNVGTVAGGVAMGAPGVTGVSCDWRCWSARMAASAASLPAIWARAAPLSLIRPTAPNGPNRPT